MPLGFPEPSPSISLVSWNSIHKWNTELFWLVNTKVKAVVFFMFSWRRCFRQLKLCSQFVDVGMTDMTLLVKLQRCGYLFLSTILKTSSNVRMLVSSVTSVLSVEWTVLRLNVSSLTRISRAMMGTSGYFPLMKRGLIYLFFNRSSGKRNRPTSSNKGHWRWTLFKNW